MNTTPPFSRLDHLVMAIHRIRIDNWAKLDDKTYATLQDIEEELFNMAQAEFEQSKKAA